VWVPLAGLANIQQFWQWVTTVMDTLPGTSFQVKSPLLKFLADPRVNIMMQLHLNRIPGRTMVFFTSSC